MPHDLFLVFFSSSSSSHHPFFDYPPPFKGLMVWLRFVHRKERRKYLVGVVMGKEYRVVVCGNH